MHNFVLVLVPHRVQEGRFCVRKIKLAHRPYTGAQEAGFHLKATTSAATKEGLGFTTIVRMHTHVPSEYQVVRQLSCAKLYRVASYALPLSEFTIVGTMPRSRPSSPVAPATATVADWLASVVVGTRY